MTESKNDDKKLHVDDVLSELGAFGPYQVTALCLIALVYSTNSMYNVNYVFAVEDVEYRCKIKQCEDGSPSQIYQSDTLYNNSWHSFTSPDEDKKQCFKYAVLGGNGSCSADNFNNMTVETCDGWVYDIPNSFVAEFNLACQDWKQALVGTSHCFGSMVGLLFQGQISDRFGRKTAAVFAGTAGAVLGLAKSFSNSYWLYVGLEGLEAAIGDALSPIFMLSIEIVPKKSLILFQMVLLNCYTGGLLLMPLIAWAVPYWRHFLRVIYAPTLLIIFYTFFLDESIRWLFSKGRKEEAVKLIKKAAKRNGVTLDKMLLNKLEYIDEDEKPREKSTDKTLLLKTFKSKIMMQRFLVCLVWWFTITLINYGMMISSVLIDGNKYVNFALLMVMDVPANVLYWMVLVRHKRKSTLLTSFLIGGVFCVCQPFIPKEYNWLALGLFLAFELLATFSYNIVYIYTSELFPTYTRNSMHAICSSVGRVGSLLAPQTPLLMSYWAGLPTLLFGLTSLLSGLLTIFMPETANAVLPDTVKEAEEIGAKISKKSDRSPEEFILNSQLS